MKRRKFLNPALMLRLAVRQALSRYYLRRCTAIGSRPRVWGRPRIINRGKLTMGNNVMLRSICVRTELVVNRDARLSVGDHTYVHDGTTIAAYRNIQIGSHVLIGRDVIISDNDQHRIEVDRRNELPESRDVVIEDHAWLADRVIVLRGVRVGQGSVVAAGSVVTKDVEPYTQVAGVPARFVKNISPGAIAREAINGVAPGSGKTEIAR